MKEIRKVQTFLVFLSLALGALAIYFYFQAAEARAEADALRAEGAIIHAGEDAEKAIEARRSNPPPE